MSNILNDLTNQEEIEMKELSDIIFVGGKILVGSEVMYRLEIKRYKELWDKKISFLNAYKRIQEQMMWN